MGFIFKISWQVMSEGREIQVGNTNKHMESEGFVWLGCSLCPAELSCRCYCSVQTVNLNTAAEPEHTVHFLSSHNYYQLLAEELCVSLYGWKIKKGGAHLFLWLICCISVLELF